MVCLVKVNYISLHVIASHLAIWPLIFELEVFLFHNKRKSNCTYFQFQIKNAALSIAQGNG